MAVEYDRHRGVRDKDERLGTRLARRWWWMWPVVLLWRAFVWVIHRLVYGLLGTRPGRFVLFAAVVWVLANTAFGGYPWGVLGNGWLGGWSGWFLALGLLFGSVAYGKRKAWEDRVSNVVYHTVPGHTVRERDVVWFPLRGIDPSGSVPVVRDLGRWLGSWSFSFRAPPHARQADLSEISEHLRERLPAAPEASWTLSWDLRQSVCRAYVVRDVAIALPRGEFEMGMRSDPARVGVVDRDHIPLGESVEGVEVWNVEDAPHVLATGETGKGKSVAQLGVLCHALQYAADWDIIACDPKRVELGYLEGYGNVRTVAKDLDDIVEAVVRAEAEMDARFRRIEAAGVNHIRKLDANAKRLMLVVDELQQVTMPAGTKEAKETDEMKLRARAALERIAALGRAAGVHLYLSTQRPDVALGILTGPLKHNLTGRLACGPMDGTSSQMALDSPGATNLPSQPKGRAIWRGIEGEKQIQVVLTVLEDLPSKRVVAKTAKTRGAGAW